MSFINGETCYSLQRLNSKNISTLPPNQSITVISVKILAGLRRKKIVKFNGKDAK